MTEPSQRRYEMRKRRDDIEATRKRIIDAAVVLHGSVGPAHTTFSGVAELAGVQRSTVYRHFPDETALFGACTSHWLARHPWPRPQDWAAISDPEARLLRGLSELYGYYAENEQMIANSFRDIAVMPQFVGEMMRALLAEMHRTLLAGWADAEVPQADLAAAIALALDFRTWRSLTEAGLAPDASPGLVTRMIGGIVRPAATTSQPALSSSPVRT